MSSKVVTVNVATREPGLGPIATENRDGTLLPTEDYEAKTATLTFNPGQLTQTFAVTVYGDILPEPHETIEAVLSGCSNCSLPPGSTRQGTIKNDDPGVISSVVVSGPPSTFENAGSLAFRFTPGPLNQYAPFSCDYRTEDITATAGSDYQTNTGTLIFVPAPDPRAPPIPLFATVSLNNDTTAEEDETVRVTCYRTRDAFLISPGVGTILNDDL